MPDEFGGIPVDDTDEFGGVAVLEAPASKKKAPSQFETALTPAEESLFTSWKGQYAPKDSGEDYDLRGAFKAGLKPDPKTGHWPDTFKKPNHPTFSVESQYAKDAPDKAGHWVGERFVAPGGSSNPARARRQANLQKGLTPDQVKARREAVTGVIESYPGFTELQEGVGDIKTPGKRKEGAHKIIVGGGKMAAVPFLAPAAIAAPIPTAAALATGMVAAPVAEHGARALGAEEDTAALVGDAAGIVAGGVAGSPGRIGSTARSAMAGAGQAAWNSKSKIPVVDALRGAWEAASRQWSDPKWTPRDPRPAPAWEQHPDPTAPAAPEFSGTPSDLPSGRSAPLASERLYRAEGVGQFRAPRRAPGWEGVEPSARTVPDATPIESDLPSGRKVPTTIERMERANEKPQPKRAPSSSPDELVDVRFDEIAKGLGAKNYASLPEAQKAVVRKVAERDAAASAPPAAPTPAPKPAPAPVSIDTKSPVTSSEVTTAKPRTIDEMLEADLAEKRAARAPKPAPTEDNNPPAPESQDNNPPIDDADLPRTVANSLKQQGVTVDQLLTVTPEQRAEILGDNAHRFDEIVRHMGTGERTNLGDAGRENIDVRVLKRIRARFPNATPEQLLDPKNPNYIDDAQLNAHRVDAGGKPIGKSGKFGRPMSEVRHDIARRIREQQPAEGPKLAPGSPGPAPAAAAVSQPLPEPAAPVNSGVTAMVRTPSGTKAKVRYRISEMDDLRNSFDEDYNTEIAHQPRDTSRAGSDQRIAQRMSDMDYGAMSQSYLAGDGAPITRVDPATGKSHAVTRNHGTESLRRLYRGDRPLSQRYKADLAEDAALAGMTPDQVAAMKHPVLHRELVGDMDPATVKQFADEANMSSTARMSPAEVANSVAGKMTGGVMAKYDPLESGAPNPEFVREILKDLSVEEKGELQTRDGFLNKRGEEMVRNAVFAKAYRSTGALEALAEDPEPLVKNLTTGMLKAAPKNAMLSEAIAQGEAYPLGIGEEVGRAVEIIQHRRENKLSVQDWLNQTEILGRDPVVHSMVDILAGEARRPNIIRDTLNNYVDTIRALGTPKQEGFFGPPELPSKLQVLEESYARAKSAADEAAAKRKGKSEGDDLFGSGR